MRIEVADIGNNRVSVGKIRHLVPPFVNPITVLRVISPCNETLLKLVSYAPRLYKGINGFLSGLVLGLREEGMDGFKIAFRCLFKRGKWKLRERIFEP